jgi:hypothetical protein
VGRRRSLVLLAAAGGLAALHARSRSRRDPHLERIQQLDPQDDHREIAHLTSAYAFPWDTETALSLALFRTFAVPTISRILLDARAFTDETRKRFDDTELLLAEVEEHGYDAPRGREAIRRINRMHAAYPIRPVDLTYVLSTFVVEPRRWIDRYGWRPLTPQELDAGWRYWREIGARMGVTDLPERIEDFEAWNTEFERAEFRYDPANHEVADATMTMYLGEIYRVPPPLLPLGADGRPGPARTRARRGARVRPATGLAAHRGARRDAGPGPAAGRPRPGAASTAPSDRGRAAHLPVRLPHRRSRHLPRPRGGRRRRRAGRFVASRGPGERRSSGRVTGSRQRRRGRGFGGGARVP